MPYKIFCYIKDNLNDLSTNKMSHGNMALLSEINVILWENVYRRMRAGFKRRLLGKICNQEINFNVDLLRNSCKLLSLCWFQTHNCFSMCFQVPRTNSSWIAVNNSSAKAYIQYFLRSSMEIVFVFCKDFLSFIAKIY